MRPRQVSGGAHGAPRRALRQRERHALGQSALRHPPARRALRQALGGTQGVLLVETLLGMLVLDALPRKIFSTISSGSAQRALGRGVPRLWAARPPSFDCRAVARRDLGERRDALPPPHLRARRVLDERQATLFHSSGRCSTCPQPVSGGRLLPLHRLTVAGHLFGERKDTLPPHLRARLVLNMR